MLFLRPVLCQKTGMLVNRSKQHVFLGILLPVAIDFKSLVFSVTSAEVKSADPDSARSFCI